MRTQILTKVFLALVTSATAQNTATGTAAVAAAAVTAKSLSPTSHVPGKAFDRIAIIWLENTDYDMALGDPNLAYLAKKGITLSNHYAVTHPSEPNYVASIGGDYLGMNNDNFNAIASNVSNVVDLLEEKGISWGEYQENMPYSGFEGMAWVNQETGANSYVRKHNPAIIYDSVTAATDRLAVIKNLTMFYQDLAANTLPQWMFITPNMTSDGHDTSVTVAGTWTRNFLDPLLTNPNFMNNTLVLITFDENHNYVIPNKILGILLGDAVPASLVGTTDSTFYNHYSELATVEANWGLSTLGRWDVGANVYSFVAAKTGDVTRAWSSPPFWTMFFNLSYKGPFNTLSSAGYPVPNTTAVYAGRAVLQKIKDTWGALVGDTPYDSRLEVPDGLHPIDY
ncbi:acid phosphatase phoa [Glonium stellatum]|uniref:Acid phosphatase phoa n=1 Tax=Glonium stellatum TaxID=574774 RepID=A0A8E2JN99_9PEZI|nr:acid phosphatase phoa [Glonium stellatum]